MNRLKNKKPLIALPYDYYYFPVLLITFVGFFDSIYLAISHFRNYVDIGYHSFCAISKSFNCDTVSQSPYSIFLNVPVPVWGILGYGLFLILLGFAGHRGAEKKRIWTMLLVISLLFSLYSIVLAIISSYYIHSYCIMCILSYGVNLSLLFYSWLIRNRFACESFLTAFKLDVLYLLNLKRLSIPIAFMVAAIAIGMIVFFPPYWHMNPPTLSKDIPTGVTEDGHPWIGARQPELEITVFSDYRCFQCKKMHYFLRRIVEENPEKIRLVHRNFPMDNTINPIVKHPFHLGSAKLAIIALFALEKGKFWEMNDLLYKISKDKKMVNLRYFARETNIEFKDIKYIFSNADLWMKLKKDIADGLQYKISGTPAFIINDKVYLAQIPADILEPYL